MASGVLNFSNGFKGCRIDEKLKVIAKGVLVVCSHEIQFMPNSRNQQKQIWSLKDIKKYGCHSNVLSIGLGTKYNDEVLHFTFKEAIVVRELMDQVIKNKHKPMTRMPSVDKGFYEMSASAPKKLMRAHSLQENSCYHTAATSMYSHYNAAKTSASSDSGSSTGGSTTGGSYENTGYDNPAYKSAQYADVELDAGDDPFSPGPTSPQKNKFFKNVLRPLKFGGGEYSKIDHKTTDALKEMDEDEHGGQ